MGMMWSFSGEGVDGRQECVKARTKTTFSCLVTKNGAQCVRVFAAKVDKLSSILRTHIVKE